MDNGNWKMANTHCPTSFIPKKSPKNCTMRKERNTSVNPATPYVSRVLAFSSCSFFPPEVVQEIPPQMKDAILRTIAATNSTLRAVAMTFWPVVNKPPVGMPVGAWILMVTCGVKEGVPPRPGIDNAKCSIVESGIRNHELWIWTS